MCVALRGMSPAGQIGLLLLDLLSAQGPWFGATMVLLVDRLTASTPLLPSARSLLMIYLLEFPFSLGM